MQHTLHCITHCYQCIHGRPRGLQNRLYVLSWPMTDNNDTTPYFILCTILHIYYTYYIKHCRIGEGRMCIISPDLMKLCLISLQGETGPICVLWVIYYWLWGVESYYNTTILYIRCFCYKLVYTAASPTLALPSTSL